MLLKIVQTGMPVLRQVGRTLTPEEIRGAEVQALIELMRETMRDAPGVGLAAPQIGEALQLAVIEDVATVAETERTPVPFHVIVNPKLELGSEAVDHRGEPVTIRASGWYARILQHEIDHLNGVLYIDRMRRRTFTTARNFGAWWAGRRPAEVIAAVGDERE
jgi:peptide deformylase